MGDTNYYEEYKKSPFYRTHDKTTHFNEYELSFLKLAIHSFSKYAKENWHEPNLKRLSSSFIWKANAIIAIDAPKPVKHFDNREFLTWQEWIGFGEGEDRRYFNLCSAIKLLLEGAYRIVSAETLNIKLSQVGLK